MKVFVSYSFEVEMPDEMADNMSETQAKSLAMELAQNINFQEVQKAYTTGSKWGSDVYIKIRSTRIEEW